MVWPILAWPIQFCLLCGVVGCGCWCWCVFCCVFVVSCCLLLWFLWSLLLFVVVVLVCGVVTQDPLSPDPFRRTILRRARSSGRLQPISNTAIFFFFFEFGQANSSSANFDFGQFGC